MEICAFGLLFGKTGMRVPDLEFRILKTGTAICVFGMPIGETGMGIPDLEFRILNQERPIVRSGCPSEMQLRSW